MKNETDSPEVMARVHEALALVQPTALRLRKTLGAAADIDELASCGQAAVLIAARKFDPTRHTSYRAFAKGILERAMITGFRKVAPLPRRAHEHLTAEKKDPEDARNGERRRDRHFAGIAAAQTEGVVAQLGSDTQGDALAISPKTLPDEASHKNQLRELIARNLDKLPPKERLVVQRHYFDGVAIDAIAREMGINRIVVRTLHERAQSRLSKLLAEIGGARRK